MAEEAKITMEDAMAEDKVKVEVTTK